jgi:hypothetical protein
MDELGAIFKKYPIQNAQKSLLLSKKQVLWLIECQRLVL